MLSTISSRFLQSRWKGDCNKVSRRFSVWAMPFLQNVCKKCWRKMWRHSKSTWYLRSRVRMCWTWSEWYRNMLWKRYAFGIEMCHNSIVITPHLQHHYGIGFLCTGPIVIVYSKYCENVHIHTHTHAYTHTHTHTHTHTLNSILYSVHVYPVVCIHMQWYTCAVM